MGSLKEAIDEERSWGKTWNGADTKINTLNPLLDMFARAGSMRKNSKSDKQDIFSEAWKCDKLLATKLLFYVRDIRGGYGERDTFCQMLATLADKSPETVEKNLWAVLEFGRAKDLYCLIGTKAENAMWNFMKAQFELDLKNMKQGKSISLLAKWIATPDAKSPRTKELGKLTAKELGYTFKTMREYKTKLRTLRAYLDIPEAKMATGKWDEIEYSKCASRFLLKNRNAFKKHDLDRYNKYIEAAKSGKVAMNMSTNTPYDVIHTALHSSDKDDDIEVMWDNLPDVCNHNVMVMADTSGSMDSGGQSYKPIEVALAMALYFSERNKGDLKDLFMTFSSRPEFCKVTGNTLKRRYINALGANWGMSTNLQGAFNKLLDLAVENNVPAEDMPEALLVISDMQINPGLISGVDKDSRMTFYDYEKKKYNNAGYKMPQVIFWNVNALSPSFLASRSDNGVSLVSGISLNVFKQAMDSIGETPEQLMLKILNSERYSDIAV
jgi:hypothetical protein